MTLNELCDYINTNTPDESEVMTSGRALLFTINKLKYKFNAKVSGHTIILFYAGKYGKTIKRLVATTRNDIDTRRPNWMPNAHAYMAETAKSYENKF